MLSQKALSYERLFAIADAQQGYFTAAQARDAGYQDSTHPYHVRTGDWSREWRGIYRLTRYPQQPEAEWVLWFLWSRDRRGRAQGVYSHQTALSIHELSDLMPAKMHLTVPDTFRRSAALPKVLVLHPGKVSKSDREQRQGYAITRALKTVLDLLDEGGTPEVILVQAAREGLRRGIIMRKELARRKATPNQKRFLREVGRRR